MHKALHEKLVKAKAIFVQERSVQLDKHKLKNIAWAAYPVIYLSTRTWAPDGIRFGHF